MHVALKKLYMSMLVSMLVLVTTVVTTYAWASISDYASTERFEIGLNNDEFSDYAILISLDGVNFSEFLDPVDIKREILKNKNIHSEIANLPDSSIESLFKDLEMHPVSTQRIGNELGAFISLDDIKPGFKYDFNGVETEVASRAYFEFDLYLTFDYVGEGAVNDDVLNQKHSVYLANIEEMITSTTKGVALSGPFEFENYFPGEEFEFNVKVNAASATRLALSKYDVVDRGNVAAYDGVKPSDLTIYQGGSSTPTVDEDGVYSFGGLMPEGDNLAFVEYNRLHDPISTSLLNEFINNRGKEIAFGEATDRWVVTEADGLTVNKMIKFTVCMWIEGFDADCFHVIGDSSVSLNLTFSSSSED